MRYAGIAIFALVFSYCAWINFGFWTNNWSLDEKIWFEAGASFGGGEFISMDHLIYGYPATTLLLPAGILMRFGLTEGDALRTVMLFLTCAGIALAAVAAYRFRPKTFWWLYVAFGLAIEFLYRESTPPIGIITPLSVLFSILVFMAYERKTLLSFLAVGAVGGLLLATRFDAGLLFFGSALVFLRLSVGTPRQTLAALAAGLGTFAAINPFLWRDGYLHLVGLFDKIFFHAEFYGIIDPEEAFMRAFYVSLFAFVSLLLAIYLLAAKRLASLPRGPVAWAVAIASLMLLMLLFSHHHPAWLFFPVLTTLELLLPFLAYDALRAGGDTGARYASAAVLMSALAGAYVVTHLFEFWLRAW